MKQILQNAKSGELKLVDVPVPAPAPGQILIRNSFSVVSPGTEKLSMDFARKSLFSKAKSRPDLVKQVVRKLRQEGPIATFRTVSDRLDAPQPLGYSCAGIVEELGAGVMGFSVGDLVACGGAGYANHAEWVVVPENLVTRVPDGVAASDAAFATLGAIALQGVRIAAPTLGEVAVVIGLGLIGQLTVQLLRSNGCRVLAIDVAPERIKQAKDQGAEWVCTPDTVPPGWAETATEGYGADFAVITASASDSTPIQLAAELCRLRGRAVVVGAMPMELDRRTFYEKELELRMSTSYGPGRYDRSYEEVGLDYPLPYVRWTENRNLRAFLDLVASGNVQPQQLDAEVVPFERGEEIYEQLGKGERRSLAVVFQYREDAPLERTAPRNGGSAKAKEGSVGVGFIGAGNYAKGVLLPCLTSCKQAEALSLVTSTGASAQRTAERFEFSEYGTDPEVLFTNPDIDLVFIATRHDSHAELAIRALQAGKAVWLEKPIGLTPEDVDRVIETARETAGFLAVGYNRRFSSHAVAIRRAFDERQTPLSIQYSIAAGPLPKNSWVDDPQVGGGRIVGEACHFVDLCSFLVGAPPTSVYGRTSQRERGSDDTTIAMLGFPDGSTASLQYMAGAASELPKERFEVSADGRSALCENFRNTRFLAVPSTRDIGGVNQDKGQATGIASVVEAVRLGAPSPFPLAELRAVSRATFGILDSARSGKPIRLDD